MAEYARQQSAWANWTSSTPSLQMVGWLDSDGDGIFDVLDVPLTLSGTGAYNAAAGRYEFAGTSAAGTLTNQNPYGQRNTITINTVDQIQYRLNGGAWMDGNSYGTYHATVAQDVPVTVPGGHTIEFRTIVAQTGVTSPVWSDTFTIPDPNLPPVVSNPVGQVEVTEDAADTVIDLSMVFDDPDLSVGDRLTYSVSVSASVPDVAAEISRPSYVGIHQDLLYTRTGNNRGFGPEHDLARDNLVEYFAVLGLDTSLQPFAYSGGTYYNVVATKPGATRPDDIYLVGAHYDSVNNPGADDNASGTAAVMEIARVLSQFTFDATLRFVAFDREEQGLYGSAAYAAAARARGDNILGMVNLDMIAYNPAGSNQDRVRLYDYVAGGAIKSALGAAFADYGGGIVAVDSGQNGQSDHRPFEQQGYDAAMVIEHAVWTNPHYHLATDAIDTPGYLDYDFATNVTTAVAGYLATAAGVRDPSSLLTATIDGGQLVLDWGGDSNGTARVTVRATDLAGDWVEDSFTVRVDVVNDPPRTAQPLDDVSVDMNGPNTRINLWGKFFDPDLVPSGDWLDYAVTANTNPGLVSATIVGCDLVLAYQANQSGTASVTIRASDAEGFHVEQSFDVVVVNTPPAIQVLDDGDAGFHTVGAWTRWTGQGYQGDVHEALPGTGSGIASWTFHGLTPGNYRVSVTWTTYSNRATNSPFRILDASTPVATIPVNQRLAPNGFVDLGVWWQDIGTGHSITGSTLVVQLADNADGRLNADAVRIEYLGALIPSPEIQVLCEGSEVNAVTGSVSFDTTPPGIPVSKVFTVKNVGTQDLILSEPIDVPDGYRLVASFGATVLGPGQSTTFGVRLDATSAGGYSGRISFRNNDADEDPYSFAVSGAVAVPSVIRVLDNGDTGFHTVGSWTQWTGQGYQGDVHEGIPGTGTGIASWTFDGLMPGIYRVSATWTTYSNRATNSPFRILDGSTLLATAQVNQRIAPHGFTDLGVSWQDIGSAHSITGSTLVVQLADNADGRLNADAVRIEYLGALTPSPEIQVLYEGSEVDAATGSVSFDTTPPGMPVTKVFTVKNVGTQDLILSEPIDVPEGYNLVASFGTTVLEPGQSTTFAVRLDATSAGGYSGRISFRNNDADEDPYSFEVSGVVAVPSVIRVLDNGDTGFHTVGSWTPWTGQGYQGDVHEALPGTGSGIANWTFDGLMPGIYRVSATWTTYSNRATNSPFRILDGSTLLATVQVNQRIAPHGFADLGVWWQDIGSAYSITGSTLVVQLADNADGRLNADAVRIEYLGALIPSPEIQVLCEASEVNAGTGSVSFDTTPPGIPVTKVFTVKNVGTQDLILSEPIDVPEGYRLVASFGAAVLGPGQSTTFAVSMDATAVGSYSGEISFRNNDADEDPYRFAVSGAVAVPPVIQVLDDGDAGFHTVGDWTRWTGQGYQGDVHSAAPGTGSGIAAWTFQGILPGMYRVSATWTDNPNRATNSPFGIFDGSTLLATVLVNQRMAPKGFSELGVWWHDLGTMHVVNGSTLVVQLADNADGFLNADAVRIERIGPRAPVAGDDSYHVHAGEALVVTSPGVLGNDRDVNLDPLTAILQTAPAHAESFALHPDGSFTYTPQQGFTGTESFTYLASDGDLSSSIAVVTLTVGARQKAIAAIWPNGIPAGQPDSVTPGISPVAGTSGEFFVLDVSSRAVGYWQSPGATELLIVSQGHGTHLDAIGVGDLIRAATRSGIDVLAFAMPGGSGAWTGGMYHDESTPLSAFVDLVAIALNYVESNDYATVAMAGLSGGGWTTTLYAALDPRVKLSIPVAGSYPLSLRQPQDIGDYEQWAPFWTDTLSYEDAYVLGASNGAQIQVLNQFDPCCFAGDGRHVQYEAAVAAAAAPLGGEFSVYIDAGQTQHIISQRVIDTIILPWIAAMSGGLEAQASVDGNDSHHVQAASTGEVRSPKPLTNDRDADQTLETASVEMAAMAIAHWPPSAPSAATAPTDVLGKAADLPERYLGLASWNTDTIWNADDVAGWGAWAHSRDDGQWEIEEGPLDPLGLDSLADGIDLWDELTLELAQVIHE
jgi:hypothetical protein